MTKIWNVSAPAPREFIDQFPEYSKIILQLLYNRNIKTQKEIDEFLNSDYEADLHNPYLYKGMREAVFLIKESIDKKEKIIIYGDYDADGVSASAILYTIFKELGADFEVFIPDRYKEGYGLTLDRVNEFAQKNVKLIVTVDCGITNVTEVELANSLGMRVIIVDHHLPASTRLGEAGPQEILPPAAAVINARQKDDTYPFKWLCGGAMAFKVVQAILRIDSIGVDWDKARNIKIGFEKWLLDLVALCTITDMVPLLGENRTLVKYGFLVMAQTKRMGLRELMKISGLEPKLTKQASTGQLFSNIRSYDIGFIIGPRINSAGRLDHANTAFELLITDNIGEAETLARHLEETNFKRQEIVEHIVKEAEGKLLETYSPRWSNGEAGKDKLPKVIFEGSTEWPAGVVGIVASKLKDKYCRPVFIYSRETEKSRGSSRSINAFNLVEEMGNCRDLLVKFGGHALAAGFEIENENLDKFYECLLSRAENLKEEDLKPFLNIDSRMELEDVDWEFYDFLQKFEPFGKDNEKPVFLLENLKIKNLKWVGNGGNHLQLWLTDASVKPALKILRGVAFRFEDFKDKIKTGDVVNVVFELDVNEWNGNRELQLVIRDLKVL